MNGFTAMFLCIMAIFVLASCENSSRVIGGADKDSVAITDTAVGGDSDTAQSDDIQNDGLISDDLLPDNEQNDGTVVTDDTQSDGTVVTDNAQNDDAQNDTTVTPDDDVPAVCDGFSCPDENSHCEAQNGEATCVCNDGYHWNTGVCVTDTLTATGTFSFDFNGPANAEGTSYQSLQGGSGTTTFSHLGADLQYGTVNIFGNLHFPLAQIQGTNIVTMWVDSFSMSGSKFFMFSMPSAQNTAGNHTLAAASAIVTYGDMTFSTSGMTINCIRAMSNDGNFTIGTVTAGQLDVTAATGNLYDPAVLGASLPYPICTD